MSFINLKKTTFNAKLAENKIDVQLNGQGVLVH